MRVLVTGAAGFIGHHVSLELLRRGDEVLGIDNLDPYYDPRLKRLRVSRLEPSRNFRFLEVDIADESLLRETYRNFRPDRVLHLAAQVGVRNSFENPMVYVRTNMVGFQHVVELVRHKQPDNFVYASSSSVYGSVKRLPFSEDEPLSTPLSLYGITKLENEMVAKTYADLYGMPSTGLRFFTVYGPYGRPDMALYKFADAMLKGEPLKVFNRGAMRRDFTYVDDIVAGTIAALDLTQKAAIYNLGCGHPENLLDAIAYLEEALGKKAILDFEPLQKGDIVETFADLTRAKRDLGFMPKTELKVGIRRFAEWFLEWRKSS